MASSIRVVKTWEELAATRAAWVELADRCGALPSARPEWVLAAWRAFGSGRLCTVMVDDPDHPGALLGLGVFIESRAPGPRLVHSAVGATGALCELLVDSARPELAQEIMLAALGPTPSIFRSAAMLGGADVCAGSRWTGSVASRPSARTFVELSPCDPGRTLWELSVDALEAGASGVTESARETGLEVRFGNDVDADEKALRHLDHAFHGPLLLDGADRRAAFVPEVLDGFSRHGLLVWPIATRGGEIVATSVWLVSGSRAMLWLRWAIDPTDGPGFDVVAAIEPLRAIGVSTVVVRDPLLLPAFAPIVRREPNAVEAGNRAWLRAAGRMMGRRSAHMAR